MRGFLALILGFAVFLTACEQKTPSADWLEKSSLPHLKFQTQVDPQSLTHQPIRTRDNYYLANLTATGRGVEGLELRDIKIRGRGTDTFSQPKKPYKLKLNSAREMLGLPAGRKWALLAGFQDGALMTNILAMQMAQQMKMPFTPELIPIEVTMNNDYQGVYWLTAHKEVAPNRIDLGKDGLLLELVVEEKSDNPLDKNYYQLALEDFAIQVQVAYPQLHKVARTNPEKAEETFAEIKQGLDEFNELLSAKKFKSKYGYYLDKKSLAKLLVIYEFTRNTAINLPESIYLHRADDGAFKFGPVWDFDTAFGGSATEDYFKAGIDTCVLDEATAGGKIFSRLLQDKKLRKLAKKEWKKFSKKHLADLQEFAHSYVDLLDRSGAYKRDYARWHRLQNAEKQTPRQDLRAYETALMEWFERRAEVVEECFRY